MTGQHSQQGTDSAPTLVNIWIVATVKAIWIEIQYISMLKVIDCISFEELVIKLVLKSRQVNLRLNKKSGLYAHWYPVYSLKRSSYTHCPWTSPLPHSLMTICLRLCIGLI